MIRILFVDDDVNVLNAMRRTLRSMRAEWETVFAADGATALAMLAEAPVDVVVSDMHMPGMDGWQFLAEVRSRHPQTVRFLLSGHADPASIMRSVGTTHQYLSKPCDNDVLKAAISQTQAVRSFLSNERLLAIVGGIGMLPSAPLTFQRLLACLRDSNSSVADVSQIISTDIAMTANIMKLVNSAFFGARHPIYSAERAVAYLGLDTVGALVLGHDVFHCGAADTGSALDYEALWQHSIATATAARAIAMHEKFSGIRADEAFLAGLLHDVGNVALAARPTLPEEYVHHAEVGGYLLGLWGFPVPVVEAVAFHHEPGRASGDGFGLAGIVHVANFLMHEMHLSGAEPPPALEAGYLEKCGVAERLPFWRKALDLSTQPDHRESKLA
jgi:HD-like signal output (HDOD) protein